MGYQCVEMDKPDRQTGKPSGSADDVTSGALDARLRQLDARLSDIKTQGGESGEPAGRLTADSTAMAKGMKLVSEFVAGIVAGGILGWLIDRFSGIQPFGLLIGLMFGFAAGLRNLYRATTRTSASAPGPLKGPPS